MVRIKEPKSAADVDIVRELFREYERAIGIDLCFQGFQDELETLPGKYGRPDGRLYLAYSGEEVSGCVGFRKIADGVCEMKRLYVRPEYRGEKIGRILAEKTVVVARETGYRIMRLDTLNTMHEAIGLYESLGFRRTEPYYSNPHPSAVYMELNLEESSI